VVWLKPVAITRAVVRRDGRIQAAGHPADHARLGVAEQRLDELTGRPGVIDEIDRHRHRDRKTKTRPGFPPGGPRLATRAAPAEITVCQSLAA
jgi:hypothetical protein